ncbi:hypothetical protein I4U23_013173 [Adineta vaga]|nr:hypothetical protein I4U23_013173 [Adineta vaga]
MTDKISTTTTFHINGKASVGGTDGGSICASITANSLYNLNAQSRTSPLRIRVYLLAQGSSRSIPFSVEGMVCQIGFDQNAANAACRSQNFRNAVLVSNIEWQEPASGSGQECIMNTESYKSVIPCEYIIHQINCAESAINLDECRFPPLFSQSLSCNRFTHVGLICT